MSTLSASAKKDLLAAREEAEGFHERAAAHFGASELAHLLGLIVAVNNGNRVMVTRRIPPGGYTP
ncbi:hypothetical protein ACIBAG_42870 [Streptomyces sp. NPDC051243]|uniref:hypothetical protein n=1 Tax=Streptomyces sp. NPDC051243 TaxID=3365646 RepID=UPI0037953F80